jgi:hypothetical protein
MKSRPRIEHGEGILEVQLRSGDQMFDSRDPAPFRERALDPDLVEYLTDGARDVPRAARLRIVFWLGKDCAPFEIEGPLRAHFEYELERMRRRRGEQVRVGFIALGIAVLAVVALTGLGELVATALGGTLGAGIREALTISGWVLMWRPIELLVYDAIPWRRDRRVLRRIASATIDLRSADRNDEPKDARSE